MVNEKSDTGGSGSESEGGQTLENLSKKIARGGGIGFGGQVAGKGIQFLFQILLTRVLGPATYGLYALGYSMLGISHRFSSLGLQSSVVRFGSMYHGEDDKERVKGVLISVLGICLIGGVTTSLLLFYFSDLISNAIFNEPELGNVIELFAISLPFYTLMTVTSAAARAFKRIDFAVGVRKVLHPLLTLTFSGIAFLLGFRLSGVIVGFLLSSVVAALIGIYLLWKIFPDVVSFLKPHFEIRKLFFYSLTVAFVGFSHLLLTKTDRIMLGIIGVSRDVGIYNAANVMAAQSTIFLISFTNIFSPIIADLHNKRNLNQLDELFKITTKWIVTLTGPVFLIFVFFSADIMGLFGPEFTSGYTVLIALGAAQLVNASVGSVGQILTMTGRQKVELANNLTLGGLNIVLNFFFIRMYGVIGAAIGTGLAIALINLVKLVEVYHIHQIIPYKRSFWKPVAASVLSSLIWYVVFLHFSFPGWWWIGGALLFGLTYVTILLSLGMDKEDKVVFNAVKKKFFAG